MDHHDFSELDPAPDAAPDDDNDHTDLLGMVRLPQPLITCCDTVCYSLLTVFLLIDIISNIGVLIIYAVHQHNVFLLTSATVFVLTSLLASLVYAVQMRHEAGQKFLTVFGCFVLNLPLQCGILGHHLKHTYRRCCTHTCCPCQQKAQHNRHARMDSNTWWIFTKLDLIHSVFNSTPQMVLNILHIIVFREPYFIQFISLGSSFALLVTSSVLHEKLRKERARNSPYGCLPMFCIILYRALVFSARILAFSMFYLYFGPFIGAILIPHFLVIMAFFIYLYHQVWRVTYVKIAMHSVCCIIAYFPIHCEYRPEGEIVLYYMIYLLENMFMVGLAFVQEPLMPYTEDIRPWSDFHKTITAFVLLFSSAGLIFMGIYYFFFHGANETISDTNIGWLAKIFEWTKRTSRTRVNYITNETPYSFNNPACLENAPVISQPQQPFRENVKSPLFGESDHSCHPHNMPQDICNEANRPAIYNNTTMDNELL